MLAYLEGIESQKVGWENLLKTIDHHIITTEWKHPDTTRKAKDHAQKNKKVISDTHYSYSGCWL